MDFLFPILGMTLILAALAQLAMWAGQSLQRSRRDQTRFDAELELLRGQIAEITDRRRKSSTCQAAAPPDNPLESGEEVDDGSRWTGYRPFRVSRLRRETGNAISVYLQPDQPFPLPGFQPGQHLTLRFGIPDHSGPLIRCYTISSAPGHPWYRITIKRNRQSPGRVSDFANLKLSVGDKIDVKPPGGKFCMPPDNRPLVLLAGGIGITPMMSMIEQLVAAGSQQKCLLFYGVHDGSDLTFGARLSEIAGSHPSIRVIKCFSSPQPDDRPQVDYQFGGFVNIGLLREHLPDNQFDFYLCGPGPFMESLFGGLREWGVPEDRIHYEAFGPATLKKKNGPDRQSDQREIVIDHAIVTLTRSEKELVWTHEHESLLDLCDANGVILESGCRTGSCGTCMTRMTRGEVEYVQPPDDCKDGHILPCIARPKNGFLDLDA